MRVTVRDWVNAMRDGSHTHSRGALRNGNDGDRIVEGSHCALGVLCDLAGYQEDSIRNYAFVTPNNELAQATYVGIVLDDRLCDLGISPGTVADKNDRNSSYDEVIEYITCDANVDPDAILYSDGDES